MANILLLYPNMKLLGYRFPYSLLPLSGFLLKAGHRVRIIDSQVEDYKISNPHDFDLIGISTLTGPQIESSLEMAAYFKKKAPRVPIIWGGVHPSLTIMQTIKSEYVDIICKGEGEQTVSELLDAIDNKKPFEGVKGLVFKNKYGEVIETGDRLPIDLNTLPISPYYLLKLNKYTEFKRKPKIIHMETSRGCPYRCGFCYCVAMHKRRWRCKNYLKTVDEIEWLVGNYRIDEIWFMDDELAVDKERIVKIAQEMLRRNIKVGWEMTSRFNYAIKYGKDFLELIKSAGCFHMSFGGESGSQKILDKIDKDITLDQVRETVKKLRDAHIDCGVNFMAGFPDETIGDMKKTFNFIDELIAMDPQIRLASISIYTPLPGTPLFNSACEKGFLPPQSLGEWGRYRYNDVNNLPYLSKKQRKLLKAVSLLTRFDFASRTYRGAGILETKWVLRFVHKSLWRLANFRWRHKFFNFPIEWEIIDFALRFLKFGEK